MGNRKRAGSSGAAPEPRTAQSADGRHLGAILDGATEDAIIALNLRGNVTQWSAGAARITGYDAAEVMGRSAGLVFTPEDRAAGAFENELRVAIDRGRAPNERWHLRKDGTRFWASGSTLPLLDGDGRIGGFLTTFRDRTDLRAETERRDLLLDEMGHRIRNLLTLVQSIAAQTARTAPPDEFLPTFDGRLRALARSQEVLGAAGLAGASLSGLLTETLAFLGDDAERVLLDGPAVCLPGESVLMLSLAVHELATNAVKYGALSVPDGWVELFWSAGEDGDGARCIDILWRETGGPPVEPPVRQGFGSQLLQRGLGRQKGAAVTLGYARGGVECCIRLRLNARLDGANGTAGPHGGEAAGQHATDASAAAPERNILWYVQVQIHLEACRRRALDDGDLARATRALLLRLQAHDRAEVLVKRAR